MKTALFHLLASRVVVILVAGLAVNLLPAYDSSQSLFLPGPSSLPGSLCNWDGVHLVTIARSGYDNELRFAFSPLVPLTTRTLSHLTGLSLPICCLVVTHCSFVVAGLLLQTLSEALFPKERAVSDVAAVMFAWGPAGVFMSACYTEGPFAALTFLGMVMMVRGSRGLAAVAFGAAGLARSNGVVLAGFLGHDAVAGLLAAPSWPQRAWVVARTAGLCALVAAPFVAMQFYAARQVCAVDGSRPYCSNPLSFYGFIQSKYWGNGFLAYYKVSQIPNFVLAAPTLGFSLAVAAARVKEAIAARTLFTARVPAYYAHMLFLATVALLFMNIQVATRFLSACPPLYWEMARQVKRGGWRATVILSVSLLYLTLGSVLFPLFLPWT
jgi:phosphatidylinositol glycan class V